MGNNKSKISAKGGSASGRKNQKSKLQVKIKKSKTRANKSRGLTIDLYNTKGKVVDSIELPKEIFGAKVNNQLLAQAVRVYLANQRKGTATTKTRGEVSGSTRKIWRQKGTGRARHGSRKAPIFVHGGIAFGPHPRDFSLKMSKKMKKLALFSALSSKLKNKEIKAIAGLEKLTPKTKSMIEVINNLEVNEKKRNILMVLPRKSKEEFGNIYRAGRNIEGMRIVNANTLNTYEVLNSRSILLMDKAIDTIKDAFWRGRGSV